MVFGNRCDKNPLLKYYTAEDFNLQAKPVEINRGKYSLKGFLYGNQPKRREIIIFVHGMGAGHLAYTTEINFFCNLGYTVLAIDSKGCNLSGGKNIGGMYEGVKAAVAAIDYANKEFPESKVYLVGHSWGGYSALCASKERKVDKVVAMSAPSSPVRAVKVAAAQFMPKWAANLMSPFLYLENFFKFGGRGNADAIKSARKNNTPTLIIQGDKDPLVTPLNGAYYGVYGKNVTKFLASGKAHNPYNTKEAEEKLAELTSALRTAKDMGEEERVNYFKNFDFAAATEEDIEVMSEIAEFLNN